MPGGSVLSEYPAPTADDLDRLRARLSLPESFLLYPAQTWPHKNHERLLEALARSQGRERRDDPARLPRQADAPLPPRPRAGGSSSAWRRRPPSRASSARASSAASTSSGPALVFPSRFEGWGLPVCEAFDAGLPVASSTATGLPDVVGDAGLLFDPDDVAEMARQLHRLWTDEGLRADLRERGRRRARRVLLRPHRAAVPRPLPAIGGRSLAEEDRILLASPASGLIAGLFAVVDTSSSDKPRRLWRSGAPSWRSSAPCAGCWAASSRSSSGTGSATSTSRPSASGRRRSRRSPTSEARCARWTSGWPRSSGSSPHCASCSRAGRARRNPRRTPVRSRPALGRLRWGSIPGSVWLDARGTQSVGHAERGIARYVSEHAQALLGAGARADRLGRA